MGASKNLSSSPSSECVTQLLRVQGHSRHHQNMILRTAIIHLIRSWCEFQLLKRRAERRCDGSGPEGSVRDVVLDSCAPVRPLGVVVLDPSPNDVVELITTEVHEEFRHSHFNVPLNDRAKAPWGHGVGSGCMCPARLSRIPSVCLDTFDFGCGGRSAELCLPLTSTSRRLGFAAWPIRRWANRWMASRKFLTATHRWNRIRLKGHYILYWLHLH